MAHAFPPHQYLRPAIELALETAARAERSDGTEAVAVPAVVRRQLRQRVLPTASLGPLRRAIEAESAFRAAVAASLGDRGDGLADDADDDGSVDVAREISYLWLLRPRGWQTQIRWLVELDELRGEVARLRDAQRSEERRRLAAEKRSQRRDAELERESKRQRSRLEHYDVLKARVDELERIDKQLRADQRALERRLRQSTDAERSARERVAELERRQSATTGGHPSTGRRRAKLAPGGARRMSRAALEHLLGSGAVVFIDGYNVAKLGWPTLQLAEQRLVLVELVEAVAQRHRADITIIFDGADVAGATAPRHRLVRVVFSSEGSSADDRIRAEVAALGADRPVVVVTNDAEIVRDVRALGADVVSSDNFLACARR